MSRLGPLCAALLGLGVWLAGGSAQTAMYRCTDASGASVFSDSTAQLKNCSPMNIGSPAPQAASRAPARTVERSEPPAADPSLPTPTGPAESPDVQTQTPEGRPGFQPCLTGPNALNPFNQDPCPPPQAPDAEQAESTPPPSGGGMFK